MKNLFLYELRKFFRQKSLYILIAAMIAFGAFVMIILKSVSSEDGEFEQIGFDTSPLRAITTFQVSLFLGIFSAIYVTGDFLGTRTIKNVYARGYTRVQVGLIKFCFLAFTTVLFCLIALAVNFLFVPAQAIKEASGKTAGFIALQILSLIAYAAFYFCLSSACGKASLALCIAIPYLYMFIGPLVQLLLYDGKNLKYIIDIIDFLPMGLPSMLSDASLVSWKIALAAALSVAYTVVFVFLGLLAFNRKEA